MVMVNLIDSPYSLHPRHLRVFKVDSITMKCNVEMETVSHIGYGFLQQDALLTDIVIKFRSNLRAPSSKHFDVPPNHR